MEPDIMTYLTIAITSIDERADILKELLDEFTSQLENPDDVEILTAVDNRVLPVGVKRDRMNEDAKGLFVVHFDDDDFPSGDYVSLVVPAIKANPTVDVINHKNCRFPGNGVKEVVVPYSVTMPDFRQRFSIKHPIRTELARLELYGSHGIGEDHAYMHQLNDRIVTEVVIDRPLYFYMPNCWKAIYNRDIARVRELDRSFK